MAQKIKKIISHTNVFKSSSVASINQRWFGGLASVCKIKQNVEPCLLQSLHRCGYSVNSQLTVLHSIFAAPMADLQFRLQYSDEHSGARAGTVTTDHGSFETPIFMPVGTAGSVK